ncbi:MAG: hypothetical protein K2X74_10185 [Acetobacteraceae bacterium]|nr:hypothetical protein [Acetobacteraceae bacterium]
MTIDLPSLLRGRTGALLILTVAAFGGLGLLGQAAGDVAEAQGQIAEARVLLSRTRAAASRPPLPAPLWATDDAALLTAFRARLDGVMAGRAVLLDASGLELDPGRPNAPRLSATLRGTAEGLHGLLLALETQSLLAVVESARLVSARAADAETGWPTVMQLSLTLRGAVVPAPAGGDPGPAP